MRKLHLLPLLALGSASLIAFSACRTDRSSLPAPVVTANSALVVLQTTPRETRWYHPIDIGQHVNTDQVTEERLSEEDLWKLLDRASKAPTEAGSRDFESRCSRLAAHRPETDHSQDRVYRKLEPRIEVGVYEFSRNQARIWVTVQTGVSRWHHFYDLIAWYLVDRSPSIDKAFFLTQQEAEYRVRYLGFGHGDPFADLAGKLGPDFVEYPGQSPSFRELYYPAHNLSVTIQDGIIKMLKHEKPGWAEPPVGGRQ